MGVAHNTTVLSCLAPKEVAQCPYHKLVHLDPTEQYQVNANCESAQNIVHKAWFVLPPVMEWFYKQQHIHYQPLPPLRSDCQQSNSGRNLDFVYPKHQNIIYSTKALGGEQQPFVAKAANRQGKVFWYLDDTFLGTTDVFHEMNIFAEKGNHTLRIINEKGDERVITIICR